MAKNYIEKYIGKYRVVSEIDVEREDFPRDSTGALDSNDLYIKCSKGNKIWHYGGTCFTAYIPSTFRGKYAIKKLAQENIPISNVEETDAELLFRFDEKYMDQVAELLKAQTNGAPISPFSVKNIPKSDYEIPAEDLERYKKITAKVPKDHILDIKIITGQFMEKMLRFDYKSDIKRLRMKNKQYIHFKGFWDEYLMYLERNL